MYLNCEIKIPVMKGKIFRQTIKGITYIYYEYGREYLPDKKYNKPQRTAIGKCCKDDPDMMIPNENYLKFFPETDIPEESGSERSSCLRIGAYIVIRKIMEDYKLTNMIEGIIGQDSGLFLDLVAYSLITENNAGQYYPDYTYNHPLFTKQMRLYSDAKVSDFLREVTIEQSVAFLNEWNDKRRSREKIYISYDSTNKLCQAGNISFIEKGHSKNGDTEPVFNYSVAYDRNNREPLFYEEYPGSIVDMEQLQYMVEKAKAYGYKEIGFILDRGYFSQPNLTYIDECGYDFVIMVKGMKSLVRPIILENKGKFEEDRSSSIREYETSGITKECFLFPSDTKKRYVHLYYSIGKARKERADLEAKIDRMSKHLEKQEGKKVTIDKSFEKYFKLVYFHQGKEDECFFKAIEKTEAINEEIRLCGYFAIITSEEMTAKEALILYKSRDASEKLFRGDKSYLGNKSLRVQTDEAAKTKIFIEFVALIIRNKIYICLQEETKNNDKRKNYMTVPAAIRELEKIEIVKQFDGVYRLDHAVTATQKDILKAFGMDVNYVKNKAWVINKLMGDSSQKGKD